MPVKAIESYEDFKNIIASPTPVIIDFWATWCGPCRTISPILEKLSNTPNSSMKFYKVDVDEQLQIAKECEIRAMPSFFVFQDGKKIGELVGANRGGLEALVANHGGSVVEA